MHCCVAFGRLLPFSKSIRLWHELNNMRRFGRSGRLSGGGGGGFGFVISGLSTLTRLAQPWSLGCSASELGLVVVWGSSAFTAPRFLSYVTVALGIEAVQRNRMELTLGFLCLNCESVIPRTTKRSSHAKLTWIWSNLFAGKEGKLVIIQKKRLQISSLLYRFALQTVVYSNIQTNSLHSPHVPISRDQPQSEQS